MKNKTIGIITTIFNGYGKFLPAWLEAIKKGTVQPDTITIVLGDNHQCLDEELAMLNGTDWRVIFQTGTNLGALKNVAVSHTPTDWIMCLDVDDLLLPDGLEKIKEHLSGDILVPGYKVGDTVYSPTITKKDVIANTFYTAKEKNFMHVFSPFRRSVWEKQPFIENDTPNPLFFIDAVLNGAEIAHCPHPVVEYKIWQSAYRTASQEDISRRYLQIKWYKDKERQELLKIL